jgi:hypothetical protein
LSFSSFASIKSALGVDDEVVLFGSSTISEDGLRLDLSLAAASIVDPVDASVGDMEVLGVTRDISMLVVELTELRLAFRGPLADGSSGAAERDTVEKRPSSIFSLVSGSDSCVEGGAAFVGVSAIGDNSASTVGRESFVGINIFWSKEGSVRAV